MTRRRLVTMTAPLGLLLGAAGPVLSHAGAVAGAAIRVFQFQPGALEVRPGTRITWTNHDDIVHTVTSGAPGSPDGRFDVRLDGKGASGGAVFADRGVYPYFCARHPSMRGEVVVRLIAAKRRARRGVNPESREPRGPDGPAVDGPGNAAAGPGRTPSR